MIRPDENATDGRSIDDQRAAARRGATEAGPLFGDAVESSHGRSSGTEAGLIAGDRDDPVLVAGVGYPLLGDLAVGTVVAYRVASWDVPAVAVADCSHTPVAAFQTITAGDYETAVLVGAEKRGDGELNDGTPSADPGKIHEYAADVVTVPDDEIVKRVGEGAMGANTIENVIAITESLGELPSDTRVIAVEPTYDSWGMNVEEFTDPVDDALDEVLDRVRDRVEAALE